MWAEKEFRNLRRMHAVGVPCPKPLMLRSHVLVMEFLGELNPQPSTLNLEPATLSLEPATLSLEPSTLNPQPSTLNPQPSTLNPQPSTLNPQPTTRSRWCCDSACALQSCSLRCGKVQVR